MFFTGTEIWLPCDWGGTYMPQWRQVAPESRCLPLAFRHTLTPRHWVSMPWSSWWRESNLLPLATVVYSSKPLARCGIWKGWVSLLTKGWQRLDLNKGALRWPVHSAQNLFSFSTPLREISRPTTRIRRSQGWNAKIGIHFGKTQPSSFPLWGLRQPAARQPGWHWSGFLGIFVCSQHYVLPPSWQRGLLARPLLRSKGAAAAQLGKVIVPPTLTNLPAGRLQSAPHRQGYC